MRRRKSGSKTREAADRSIAPSMPRLVSFPFWRNTKAWLSSSQSRCPIPDSRHSPFPPSLLTTYICVFLSACSSATDPITIDKAWAPATPPGTTVGAAYMLIDAREADTLVGFRSPIANSVELHRTSLEGGVTQMRKVDSVVISPNTPLELAPSGLHLMLQGLSAPLEAGQHITVILRFQEAGEVPAQVEVVAPGAQPTHH
jgi:periplasmic copper chaperone A